MNESDWKIFKQIKDKADDTKIGNFLTENQLKSISTKSKSLYDFIQIKNYAIECDKKLEDLIPKFNRLSEEVKSKTKTISSLRNNLNENKNQGRSNIELKSEIDKLKARADEDKAKIVKSDDLIKSLKSQIKQRFGSSQPQHPATTAPGSQ